MKSISAISLAFLAMSLLTALPPAKAQSNKLFNADSTRNCQMEPEQFRERCEARNKAVRLCVAKKDDDFQKCVSEKIEDVGAKKNAAAAKR